MTRNRFLSTKTAADIDRRVARVLRGLGNPEPPLHLELVRDLLKLDRAFYSADDPDLARETISRIKVAAVQVFRRPTLLLEAIEKLSLRALYLPDQKRILLDESLPPLKHRWNEAHEIGHSIIPWHEGMMFGDDRYTLSHECHEHMETEANYAAGRLLFLQERFTNQVHDLPASIETVRAMKTEFGNTLSTTLYRMVEVRGEDVPIVGLISVHPHTSRRPANQRPDEAVRHFIRSAAFLDRFAQVGEMDLLHAVGSYCGSQGGGRLGEAELVLEDDNGERHRFFFETFFNRYDALTLGVHLAPEAQVYPVQGPGAAPF